MRCSRARPRSGGAAGEDEFVELDEEGKPKVEQKAAAKKAPTKKRGRVTKIRSKGRARPQSEEGAGDEAPAEGEDEAESAS